MRTKIVVFLLINTLVVLFLLHQVWTLLSLLVVDGHHDAISPDDLPALGSKLNNSSRPAIIPKIIHQTYKNNTVPQVWREAQQSCKDLHKDYEYMFWTDESARKFIADEYDWFLEIWDNYPFGIERADAIRYFVLYHFGGIYIDLDDGCKRPLDPLLIYPSWVRRTTPTGISNDAMGAVPNHPFFNRTIHSLQSYNRSWLAPYITVMSSTGPLFLSLIWRHHNTALAASASTPSPALAPASLGSMHSTPSAAALEATEEREREHEAARVRILFPAEYMGSAHAFFTHHKGDSWHKWDSDALFWMRRHWLSLTVTGVVVAGFVFALLWFVYSRCCLGRSQRAGSGRRAPPVVSPRLARRGSDEKVVRREGEGLFARLRGVVWGRGRGRRRGGRGAYVPVRGRDEED